MRFPIADLHCDLLCYLAGDPDRTPFDPISRCSIQQMREGGVKCQVLAIFSETGKESVKQASAQLAIYEQLPTLYPHEVRHLNGLPDVEQEQVAIAYAFEGASTFCTEDEPLEAGFNRLKSICSRLGKPIYISFTWNTENRFGGGAFAEAGLKEDGRRLLDEMHQQQIAVDLSHASDALAHDIFQYVDQRKLDIPIIASHSNSRAVTPVPRNLPDELAQEIIKRNGLIGLNFYYPFIGPNDEHFAKQIEYWVRMGADQQICFGADFFYDEDFPTTYRKNVKQLFSLEYGNSSCYGRFLDAMQRQLNLSPKQLKGLASENLVNFMRSVSKTR